MNKNILTLSLTLIIMLLFQSCSSMKLRKTKTNNQIVEEKIKAFLYKLNRRISLKKKRISYHLDSTRGYKNLLEQLIVDEQTVYGYIVINRSYISALEIEQDLDSQESTLNGVDVVIIAKSENRSIILKALTVKNENILTMDVIKLIKKNKSILITQSDKPLDYYQAIKYCQDDGKNIPDEYDAENIEKQNLLFWTNKSTKNSNMAMIYDTKDNQFFEAIRADTFDVVCVGK